MPDEARQMLDEVKKLAGKVAGDLERITRALRWYRWFAVFLIVVLVALAALGSLTYQNAQCNSDYSNASRTRTDALTRLSTPRSDALAKLLRDAFVPKPDQAKLDADKAAYKAADEAYTQGLADHPIPPAPSNHCSLF